MDDANLISKRFAAIDWALDERLRRLFAASEAVALGYGGVTLVAAKTGVSRRAIHQGISELRSRYAPTEDGVKKRIRKPGAGRKRTTDTDATLAKDLGELIEPTTRGDPESSLRWTCKSVRQLSKELCAMGHRTSHRMVAEMLHESGYSLQANKKTIEGENHPDRNEQFEYINRETNRRLRAKTPVISVDTKKKELVGDFKNAGREWMPKGEPQEVRVHDFIIRELGRVSPYGIYDIARNEGWVSVGIDHDTASFAVESIRRWWKSMGRRAYPDATELFVTADGGGSNGYRIRLWKVEIQKLADELRIPITICHFPPGTSKWNKIEHRMFSFITQNWRAQPLVSYEVIISLIAATTTETGLKIRCKLDTNKYPDGVNVTAQELESVHIKPHKFHGEWNYTISPRTIRR